MGNCPCTVPGELGKEIAVADLGGEATTELAGTSPHGAPNALPMLLCAQPDVVMAMGSEKRKGSSPSQPPTRVSSECDADAGAGDFPPLPSEQPQEEQAEDEEVEAEPLVAPEYTESQQSLLRKARRQWTRERQREEQQRNAAELAVAHRQTRAQMVADFGQWKPANRYGTDARLPTFQPGKHVPTLALINPHSGAGAGFDILDIARRMPYYQRRFFNIIEVVKDQRRGGLLDVFRLELNAAKEEAKAQGTRARVISGGGDGTASFALFIIFAALRADDARAEEGLKDAGNGFIWSDAELAACFPALAQMPLGSANDFGNTLGWGRKYPGDRSGKSFLGSSRADAEHELQAWIEAAISPSSRMANFDLWGITPASGSSTCNFKLAELVGPRGWDPRVEVKGQRHLAMKEAGTPIPLFVCLYFSAGFGAYMTARFQINRRKHPFSNKLEYGRQAAGIAMESVPPQLNPGLEGVRVTCKGEQYFPPRNGLDSEGSKYREVGFLNINWQAGMAHGADRASVGARLCSTREPAKFNDGKVDMYRLKFASLLKNPGPRYQTDKREGAVTLTHTGGSGKGIFFQWDGEARFAFSPSGEPFDINIRKILNVPVVLGPLYDARVTGDPGNGQPASFSFAGETPEERVEIQQRVLRCVRGELDAELNATREEIVAAGLHYEER